MLAAVKMAYGPSVRSKVISIRLQKPGFLIKIQVIILKYQGKLLKATVTNTLTEEIISIVRHKHGSDALRIKAYVALAKNILNF